MRSLVVLPTYNEADNIVGVITAIGKLDLPVEVLVVDDSSPDGTAGLVKDLASERSDVSILVRPSKSGLGSAYREGFRWGLERGFEALVEMDSDFSHDPAQLRGLLGALEGGADLVVGSRYVPGGRIPDWSLRRRALSRGGNLYAKVMLGIDVADMTSGYRAYRASLLRRMDLPSVRSDGYGFQIEMVRRAIKAGGRVVEVPISFSDRKAGKSKMSGSIVAEALLNVTTWGVRDRVGELLGRRSRRLS